MRKVPAGMRTNVMPIEFLTIRTPLELAVADGPPLVSGPPPTADNSAAALAAAASGSNVFPRLVAGGWVAAWGKTDEPGFRSEISFDPSGDELSAVATVTPASCSASTAAFR